jgi:vacuolar-type H+-ATPase subunit E/Vma4
MGSAEILRAIADDTDREVARLLDDATARATEIVATARRAAQARVDEAVTAADPELRAEASRTINAARVEMLHARAAASAARLAAAFELAERRLPGTWKSGDSRWRAALLGLAGDALSATGAGSTLTARPIDCDRLRPLLSRGVAEIISDSGLPAGVIARSADGRVEVDATVTSRLAGARRLLAEEVVALLEVAGEQEIARNTGAAA